MERTKRRATAVVPAQIAGSDASPGRRGPSDDAMPPLVRPAGAPATRLRIIHVTRQFWPSVGGLENMVASLAKAQADAGHQVTVVTLNRVFGHPDILPRRDTLGRVDIVRVPFVGSRRYPIAPAALSALQGADVVHVHAIDFFFDYLWLTRRMHRAKLVVTTHGGFFHTSFARRLKALYFQNVTRRALGAYAHVVATSENDLQTFSQVRPRDISFIANGVDVSKFAGLARSPGAKQLIYFGRLAPHKGLTRALVFFAALAARDPEWRLTLAGRPFDLDVADVRAEARALGLEDRVDVVDTPSDGELAALIAGASAFVSASEYEGFGIAALEAVSAGLLPVLSDIAAHRDTVGRTGLGLLLDFADPVADAEAFLDAWEAWRVRPPSAIRLQAALLGYAWDAAADSYERVYRTPAPARRLLGLDIQARYTAEAVAALDTCLDEGRSRRVAFVNAHLANLCHSRPDLAQVLAGFELLPDGIGIDFASWLLLGRSFPQNLNGTDFVPAYLSRTRRRLRIFLLGASEDCIRRTAEVVAARWPQHEVVGTHHGYFADRSEVDPLVRAAQADLILVGMGNPRQEFWLDGYAQARPFVGIGVGALFDFLSGQVSRAPAWMRRLRCEWMFRLYKEPGRLWRRYLLGNVLFLIRAARLAVRPKAA